MNMARAERDDLAEFLATLTPQQWATASLCTKWTVKDVVAHLISYEELGTMGLIKRFVKGEMATTFNLTDCCVNHIFKLGGLIFDIK